MYQSTATHTVDLQRYKISTQKSDIAGDDGFKLFIEKRDTIYNDEGHKYTAITKYTDSGDNGIEIFFTTEKQLVDKSETKSEPQQQSTSNKTETVLWEKSCVPERHYLYRIMQERKTEEPVVAKLMEHVVIFDRPCLFRLSDLIKQYKTWINNYPDYLHFKSCALGPYVDPPHPFSESYGHLDGPTCVCRLCIANRKVVEILESEGVTLDHVLDSAIDCIRNRLSNIIISQIRMSFLQKSNVYLDLSDGFEAIVPPLTILRFEKFFKELYETGMTISWEILKKLSLIVGYDINYNAAIHFITYLFESADKFVEVAERLEPMFICFDWKLIHYGLYFKVFLLHFFQEFVFQRPEIIGTWTLCYDIVRNNRQINSDRPGEMCTKDITDKYDALVVQMNVVKDLWEAKSLPFEFEEMRLPIHNVLKISSLFPPYRPLEENVKMTYTAIWNEALEQYELGPLVVSENKILDLDPILDVCLTNPKNKDEKVCIQVLCKDKPIIESTESLSENTQWGRDETLIQAVRKIFEEEASGSKFSDTMTASTSSSSHDEECATCSSKSENAPRKRTVSKRKVSKPETPRYAIYGRTPYQKLAAKWLQSQKKRLNLEFCKHYEKKTINDRMDYMMDKHSSNITDPKSHLSTVKHRAALQDILSFAMQMGANAVSCMENKVRHNPQNYKFYVVFHYSKCKIPEKKEPKVLVPLDQIMSLLFGTLYKHSILTDKERRSVFFQQFQGNEVNKTRDPNAKNIDWEACNANVTLSAQKLTPVPSEDTDKEAKDSSKISDEGEEFLDLIQNALETAFEEPERKKVKKRLLEAFQPLLNFMEPKQEFPNEQKSKIFVKGFDKLRPIRVLTNLPPKKGSAASQEGASKKTATNTTAPDLAHENMEVPVNSTAKPVPKGYVEVPAEEFLDDAPEDDVVQQQLEQKQVRPNCFLARGEKVPLPSELEPTLRIPKKCEIQIDKYLDNVIVTPESKRNDFDIEDGSSEDEEIDVVNCCGTPNCTRNHSAETRFEHVHGCLGGPQADPNCECYKSRSVASMLLSDDYHRCASQMSGLPVNPKYSQMRQKLLKTLSQRRDTGEECETNGAAQAQKSSVPTSTKNTAKKETVVVTKGGPQTEDVDALVSMIEGTNISSDPKKAAKRARQREKKMKLQKEEDERRLKLEEEQRRLEDLRQQEVERLRLEEEERLARERQESLALKKSKKKKKKGKNTTVELTNSLGKPKCTVTIIDAMPAIPLTDKGFKTRIEKGAMEFSEATSNSINEKILGPDSEKKADKKTDMVTIRRHPTVPDTTVTISMKSNSGQEDVLYTLINGQVYETETPENNREENGQTKIKTKASKKKKKKGKNKDNFGCIVSCGTQEALTEEVPKSNEDPDLPQKNPVHCDIQHTVDCERPKPSSFLNTLSPESEIDLSKLKLPPGITITKVNQNIPTNRAFVGAVADNTKEVTITKSTVGHFGNGSPPPFYNNEVFKKPNVLVVDSQYTEPADEFISRKEGEKFKEVVSTKTKRLRNRAQRSKDGDDLEEDFCEADGGDKFLYSSDNYYPRSPSFSSKKTVPKPKVGSSTSSSSEVKTIPVSLPNSTVNVNTAAARNFVHPTRIFRNQQMGSYDSTGEQIGNRSRYGNGVHSKYNVIPRYAKSRQRMNAGQESPSTFTTSPKSSTANPNPVPAESPSNNALGSITSNQSFATSSDRFPPPPNIEASVPEESNSKIQKEERWSNPVVENEKLGADAPNVFNVRWDALLKESYGSTFGPFTVQAVDRKAWSPWGELSGTEASSPDLSSRPHSCELLHNDVIDNGTIGLPPSQKCVSPVQPPVPIGVPPSRDSNPVNSLSQHFKRQCLVNPIARPSSRNSRPDSMLSNRSSVEDLSLGRILPPNAGTNPPNGTNVHLSGSNTPFGVRDLFSSTNRHDVFGETSFTPGFRDMGVSNSMAERHRTTANTLLSSIKSQPNNFESHEQFGFTNENMPNNNLSLKNHFLPNSYSIPSSNPPMSGQWGDNQVENFPTSFGPLNSRPYNNMCLHNNNYDSNTTNTSFGHGNGEPMYGAFQTRAPETIESLKMRWDINSYPNSPGAYCPGEKIDYNDFNSPFFMKAAHAAVGAERIGNSHFVGQPCYPTSFEQP